MCFCSNLVPYTLTAGVFESYIITLICRPPGWPRNTCLALLMLQIRVLPFSWYRGPYGAQTTLWLLGRLTPFPWNLNLATANTTGNEIILLKMIQCSLYTKLNTTNVMSHYNLTLCGLHSKQSNTESSNLKCCVQSVPTEMIWKQTFSDNVVCEHRMVG
jgi:hypothetical protein